MDSFRWDANFETGLSTVDEQHRHLVELTNQFGSLLANSEIQFADIETLYTELTDYTNYLSQKRRLRMAPRVSSQMEWLAGMMGRGAETYQRRPYPRPWLRP